MPVLRPSGTQKRVGDRRAKYIAVVHSYPSLRLLDNGRSRCFVRFLPVNLKYNLHISILNHACTLVILCHFIIIPRMHRHSQAFIDEGSVWRAKRDILRREEGGVLSRDYWYDGINRFGRESRIIKLNFSRISLSGGRRDADVLPIPTMSAQPTWRVHQVNHVSGHIKSRARAALLSSLFPHLSPAASAAVPGREY